MTLGFAIIAALIIGSAVAAMTLRHLIHCSLALVVAFAGLAAVYLQLHAQFVGFAQLLVYVGAVSILVVFAILLTRSGENREEKVFSTSWVAGVGVVIGVAGVLVWAVSRSELTRTAGTVAPTVTVRQIGEALMHRYVLPLEVIGLLLTAALIGAVIIAMHEKEAGHE
ncbi:MAG TPA: NADH-quinone oxidoreductase subunit J [Verrucomicrobiae bacterium]|nr:NADH-quinone oxidoreductase subunit J [Verrucomicrobiae bacterium]